MEKLNLSNSCLNCFNIDENSKICGIHNIAVEEKYTCDHFSGVE